MNLDKLQEILNKSKRLSNDFDRNIKLTILEAKYQEYITKFSPAYLSGSPIYVGPSLIEHINKQKINGDLLSFLFFVSYKLGT